jgi:hypothetical protein
LVLPTAVLPVFVLVTAVLPVLVLPTAVLPVLDRVDVALRDDVERETLRDVEVGRETLRDDDVGRETLRVVAGRETLRVGALRTGAARVGALRAGAARAGAERAPPPAGRAERMVVSASFNTGALCAIAGGAVCTAAASANAAIKMMNFRIAPPPFLFRFPSGPISERDRQNVRIGLRVYMDFIL